MSKTLKMAQAGWELIRAMAARGRYAAALAHLTRLLALPNISTARRMEGHRLAGELALMLGRFVTARRHLRAAAALAHQADTYYLLGRAWEDDPHGCDRRAARQFRKAVSLDPANPLYRAAYGRAVARRGQVQLAVRELTKAADQAPGDVAVIRVVVDGLLAAGRFEVARNILYRASFLRPTDSDLAALRTQVKFETARLMQHQMHRTAQDTPFTTESDPATIPFGLGPRNAATAMRRRDTGSTPRPHLARLPLKRKW